jgi:hypothetical protein
MYDHYATDSLIDGKRQSIDIWDTVRYHSSLLSASVFDVINAVCHSPVKRIWIVYDQCVMVAHTYFYFVSLSQGTIHHNSGGE